MTDETYQRILDHVKLHAIPPTHMLPRGLPLNVIVDDLIPGDEPELYEDRIQLCTADYADLRRRAQRHDF